MSADGDFIWGKNQYEEELRRRMALAKQQGWSDADIKRSALVDRAARTARMNADQQKAPRAGMPKKVSGRGGFLTSLISEGSGTLGAVAGGAFGSLLGPVGTVAGAGLGAALFGGAGSAAEQKVRDDKVNWGKAASEGAMEGIFSAGPLRATKVVGKLVKGAAEGQGSKLAEEYLAKKAAGTASTTTKMGQTLRAEARGTDVGQKVNGSTVNNGRSKELNDFLERNVKVPKGSAAKQSESVEQYIAKQSDDLTKAIAKGNRPLTDADRLKLMQDLVSKYKETMLSPTDRQNQILRDIAQRIAKTHDLRGVDDLRKTIDDNINFSRNSSSPEPLNEQVYDMARRHLTDAVADVLPNVKGIKNNMHQAFTAQELMLKRAGGKGGSGFAPGGIDAPGRATQTVQSVAGSGLGWLGKHMDAARGFGPRAMAPRVVAGSTVNSMAYPTDQQQPDTPAPVEPSLAFANPQSAEEDTLNQLAASGKFTDFGSMAGAFDGYTNQASASPEAQGYSADDLTQAAIEAAVNGDYKASDQLMQLAKAVRDNQPDTKLSADQQKAAQGTTTASKIIDQLEQDVAAIPAGRVGGGTSSLLGLLKPESGPGVDAEAYNQSRGSTALMLIKALQGSAGQISDADRQAIENAIPLSQDSVAIRKKKLEFLRNKVKAYEPVTAQGVYQ